MDSASKARNARQWSTAVADVFLAQAKPYQLGFIPISPLCVVNIRANMQCKHKGENLDIHCYVWWRTPRASWN